MNLIFFRDENGPHAYKDLKEFCKGPDGTNESFKFIDCSSLKDVVNFIKENENSIVLFSVSNLNEVKVLYVFLKKLTPYIKKNYLKIICCFTFKETKYRRKLNQCGVSEFFEENNSLKSLVAKLKFLKLQLKTYGGGKTNQEVIKYLPPMNNADDFWILKKPEHVGQVLLNFLVRLRGPGPHFIHWSANLKHKKYPLLKCWKLMSERPDVFPFLPKVATWYFCGNQKAPTFDQKNELWVFTGKEMALFIDLDGEMQPRFETIDNRLQICENSAFAIGKEDIIKKSIDDAKTFNKQAQKSAGNEEVDNETDKLKTDPFSGDGGSADKIDGSLQGKGGPSDDIDGNMEGEIGEKEKDLGGNYEGRLKKKKQSSYSEEEDGIYSGDEDFESDDDMYGDQNEDSDEMEIGLSMEKADGGLAGKGGTDKIQKYMGHKHDHGEENNKEKDYTDEGKKSAGGELNGQTSGTGLGELNGKLDKSENNRGPLNGHGNTENKNSPNLSGQLNNSRESGNLNGSMNFGTVDNGNNNERGDGPEIEGNESSNEQSTGSLSAGSDKKQNESPGISGGHESEKDLSTPSFSGHGEKEKKGKDPDKYWEGGLNAGKKQPPFFEGLLEDENLNLESGEMTVSIFRVDKPEKSRVECQFVDLFEDNLTLKSMNETGFEHDEEIGISLNFHYLKQDAHLELVGTLVFEEEEEDEDGIFLQFNLKNNKPDEIKKFMNLYMERQKNIAYFFEKMRVE